MAVIRADLHAHTNASDGVDSPASVARMAAEAGLDALAITDHDTMAGVEEAVREGKRLGLLVLPGIELSASEDGIDIHVLGYGMDADDPLWRERLLLQGSARTRRNERMVERLQALGIELTLEEAMEAARAAGAEPASLGRPHLASVLVAKGAAASIRDAFDRYLGEGAPGYAALPRIAPEEAVEWIIEAGGVPVLAHPGLYGRDDIVKRLASGGRLAGIETSHPSHDERQEQRYAAIADRFGLFATGGSDYHGNRGGEQRHSAVGAKTADAAPLLERLAAGL
ncbi:PHP domain-containing protein [Paenibacillus sp. FSL W8-1187]|uniref:PHP domain-containing protein n=1 Tax=unclassified Paenibacillus TaxID=185978 RepID=UPI00129B9482|nr:PHP domain-containing protein [Paenibacillus sp. B01]QGG56786.1 PHP domain-containing protein [Paenibacillus sp. B01]